MARLDEANDGSKTPKVTASAPGITGGLQVGTPSAVQGRPKADEETLANVTMIIQRPELKTFLRNLRKSLEAGTWEDVVAYLQGRDAQVMKLEAKVVELEQTNKTLKDKIIEKIWKLGSDYVKEIDEIVNPPKKPNGK